MLEYWSAGVLGWCQSYSSSSSSIFGFDPEDEDEEESDSITPKLHYSSSPFRHAPNQL